MLDESTSAPNQKGKLYGLELESTYEGWFHANWSDREELDRDFQIDERSSPVLTIKETGTKPILFLYNIPNPYIRGKDQELMLRIGHEFGILAQDELDFLIHCLSVEDNYPNDFWLILRKTKSLLGRTPHNLLKFIRKGEQFINVFSNLEQHATVIKATLSSEGFNTLVEGYFTRSEGMPYADSIVQLGYKLRPILTILNQNGAWRKDIEQASEIEISRSMEDNPINARTLRLSYGPFGLTPKGILRRSFGTRSRKIIALVAIDPPSFSSRIKWLNHVSPWLVYAAGGTVDSYFEKGKRFRIRRLKILELENVILSQLVLSDPITKTDRRKERK